MRICLIAPPSENTLRTRDISLQKIKMQIVMSVVRIVKNVLYLCLVEQSTDIFMKVFSHCPD